ncbi:MAG: hypothetical protein OXT09_17045 [Myxococcales bacterium]|nr:hypothetical protein [Myxococcales bacterium]
MNILTYNILEDLFLRAHPGGWRPTRPTDLLADRPRQRLDYALASADLAARLQACEPIDTPASRRASDHLPLLACLRP